MQHDLRHILRQTLKTIIPADNETLFNLIIRSGPSTENRLIVDIKAAREAYNEVIIDDIIRIRRNYNLADAITKCYNTKRSFRLTTRTENII